MALAVLELLDFDRAGLRFRIDTGTNRYYQLRVGRAVERRQGIDWVDEVAFATEMSVNEAGGGLFNSSKEVAVPAPRFEGGQKAYAQLFSFKTAEGRSPAFSSVVRVPLGAASLTGPSYDFAPALSVPTSTAMNTIDSFNEPRRVACRTYGEVYARQASVEELLAEVVKVGVPLALKALAGKADANQQKGPIVGMGDSVSLLGGLINALLGAGAGAAVSRQQSLAGANRFGGSRGADFSKPFALDWAALLGAIGPLIGPTLQGVGQITGPIAQMLPQIIKEEAAALPLLINALNQANQHRVQIKESDNKLASDLLSDVNRRLLLEQFIQAQRQAPAGTQSGQAGDLSQLIQLLQQTPAAKAQPQPAPVAVAKSLSQEGGAPHALSDRAVVTFQAGEPVAWNGSRKVLFARGTGIQLKATLTVREPAPKAPLPKAILRFVFKDGAGKSVLFEKSFRQKDVPANSPLAFNFTQEETARLPANRNIAVLAEMRWLSPKSGRQSRALGSTEIVLVDRYFLKEQGAGVSAEKELTDMKQFRPFWNKVWEAPTLSRDGDEEDKKYLWELNVNAKYSVLLSAAHEENGLMATKTLRGDDDEESLSAKTEGRMKAGVELSVAELNKLLPLWEGESALERDRLEAFMTEDFARNNAAEFVYNLRLKGRAGERGMVWVAPVFKLFECTLAAVSKTDEAGQVVATAEEKVRFPLPVAARVIGLKSQR